MAAFSTGVARVSSLQWHAGLAAGLAGGAAEVAWIMLYAGLRGGTGADVAVGVTATVAPGAVGTAAAVPLGLVIHFALAAVLGVAVAVGLRRLVPRLAGSLAEMGLIVGILALVWAMNFLVILPLVNPAFVHIVPMPVSLASKLLFGIATALVLRMRTDARIPRANTSRRRK